MVGLVLFFPLLALAAVLAYRLSSASRVKKRMQDALSPFEGLMTESQRLRQAIERDIELSSNQYIQRVHTDRLKTIPLDELKKYATGMRLQALKDIGVCSVADLQGWHEYRVSQVRGVGPKSANAIVRAVATITATAQAIPIDRPSPPFAGDFERHLMQALYRQRWFDVHVAQQSSAFTKALSFHQNTRDEVIARTRFSRWLWRFGSSETIRQSIDRAQTMVGFLEEESSRSMRDSLSTSLDLCRTVCGSPLPIETIVHDFHENSQFYDSWLNSCLGKSDSSNLAKLAPPHAVFHPVDSNLAHIEFGRTVPGPPPVPTGRGWAESSSEKNTSAQTAEQLISISIGPNARQQQTGFALPMALRAETSSNLRWLPRGESTQIQGHTLPHGFVYLGEGANFEQHYALNSDLPARTNSIGLTDVGGHYSSYAALSPEQRSGYLDWLAQGASTATEQGFGMLYFYGLERRVIDLIQKNISDPPIHELEELLEEVRRLWKVFHEKPGSVTLCCQRLSDFAAAHTFDGISIPELPKSWVKTYELPLIMRYGLGCFMKDGRPIPTEWALRWAYVEPTIYLRTPAIRCAQEFETAFATIYREKFGEGLIISANKTKLKLTYQPGWPMHAQPEMKYEVAEIPDIGAFSTPKQTLKALVEESTALIDGYSRYIGRNIAKAGTLEAFLNLPLRVWPSAGKDRWQVFLASIVDPMEPITLESLLRELGYVGDPAVAKVTEIVANLNRSRVGFEPDILAGARRPRPSEMAVLFPLTSESDPDRTTNEYKKASLTVSLSACIALADGHVSEEETAAVEAMIASWQHLHIDLRTRLRAQYRLHVRQEISLTSFKARLSALTPDGRIQLALALSSLATVDGNIASAEVKLLEQVYRILGLESQLLYSHLHGESQRAHSLTFLDISSPSETRSHSLDAARLAALRQETEQVSALLAGIFTEEETTISNPTQLINRPALAQMHPEEELLPGLDSKHQQFVAELLQKPSWTRSELEAAAAKLQIMLDGALERINEATFDLTGEPLTEGNDPVYVQQGILENAK